LKHGIINSYPSLKTDIDTEVVIVGAGISGALTAWYLCKAGFDVTIIDRRHIGMGSTVASTSLLQYEIDTPLHELILKIGREKAVKSYLYSREAIYILKAICNDLGDSALYINKPSLQFASYKKDLQELYEEYELRRQAGIRVKWLEGDEVEKRFGFKKPGGILSKDGAEADAYKITHAILEKFNKKGLQIYDHTEVINIRKSKKGVELETAENKKIKARNLVIACGYESQRYIPQKIEYLQTTFAIASEPIDKKDFWYKNAIIWETARPYLYLRTTPDQRIIVGGKDIELMNPQKRDKLMFSKRKSLERSFKTLFPHIAFNTDFSWAGVFGNTKDGLPYIGTLPGQANIYFALGFGGNGILFSVIAAQMIRDALTGKKNGYEEIFSLNR
jgi:glycine/D-amino acid oxidase-like deaminating enzyme